MKKLVLLLVGLLTAAILFGCSGGGGASSAGVSSEVSRKSSHTKSQPESLAESDAGQDNTDSETQSDLDSGTDSSMASGGAYEANGFQLSSAELIAAPDGLGGSPVDTDIVFLLNNVTDGSVTMTSDRADVLVFSAEYEMDSAVSGVLKLGVTDESGTVYERENETEFAQSGANTFEALIKTGSALSGAYTLEWYIDGQLAAEAVFTK